MGAAVMCRSCRFRFPAFLVLHLLIWTKLLALEIRNQQAESQLPNRRSNVRRQPKDPRNVAYQ